MTRETCYRCFWPKALCWCASIQPIETATRFVFLMHPKEFKHEKAATGRLTHLCLARSEIQVGVSFEQNEGVQAMLADPTAYPVLLYPGPTAYNLTELPAPARPPVPAASILATDGPDPLPSSRPPLARATLQARTLTVFLLDATWSLGRKMLKLSPSLQGLPRIMFTPTAPSRYVIKQQPQKGCLSTLEATHELLVALERAGLDRYTRPTQLIDLFERMQAYQIRCASDPAKGGYRRRPYSPPGERAPARGKSGARRTKIFKNWNPLPVQK